MFLALVITLVISSPYLVWQFWLRPYCLKNGKGYTAGSNWGATMWVDWQEAKELAAARGDSQMILACRFFLWIHLGFLFCGILALIASMARG